MIPIYVTCPLLTDTQRRALEVVEKVGTVSLESLSENLWPAMHQLAKQKYGVNHPASRILWTLERMDMVDRFRVSEDTECVTNWRWTLSDKGRWLLGFMRGLEGKGDGVE